MLTDSIQILQVEDDEDDRVLFSWALKKAGIEAQVTGAVDGAECMSILETFLPEVIFLDINMAGMNGKECLKLIRANNTFNTVPVIRLTTSDHEVDITETFDSGATLYMVKPFRTDDMAKLLKRIFTDNWQQVLQQRERNSFVVKAR